MLKEKGFVGQWTKEEMENVKVQISWKRPNEIIERSAFYFILKELKELILFK